MTGTQETERKSLDSSRLGDSDDKARLRVLLEVQYSRGGDPTLIVQLESYLVGILSSAT